MSDVASVAMAEPQDRSRDAGPSPGVVVTPPEPGPKALGPLLALGA